MLSDISAEGAQKDLYGLLKRVNQEDKPVRITGNHGNVVLVSEKEWQAIRETLYLVGKEIKAPGTSEPINDSNNENHSETVIKHSTKISWDQL